jgi:MFS family permease
VSAVGYSLGPVLGGFLTHAFGWRSNFYLSGALALVGFALARMLLPPESYKAAHAGREPFDFFGAASFALAIAALLVALALAQGGGWRELPVVLAALTGTAALAVFIRWEKRRPYPLLDLTIFRIGAFTLGNIARWLSFVTMSVSNLLMPFFLQLGMGLDPLRTGLLIAPTAVTMALLAPLTGWMSERFAPERLCAAGLAINGAALLFLSSLGADSGAPEVVFGLALLGVGMGIFQTPNNNLLMSSVPRHRLGVGSSVLSIVRSLGYSLGATLGAAIVSHFLFLSTGETSLQSLATERIAGDSVVLAGFLRGYRCALWAAAALAFAGALVSLKPATGHPEVHS